MKKILFILLVTFLTFNSHAFEVKGFRGGMLLDEAVSVAHSKNWYLKPWSEVLNPNNLYMIVNQSNKKRERTAALRST